MFASVFSRIAARRTTISMGLRGTSNVIRAIIVASSSLMLSVPAFAQSATQFTYQGRLDSGGGLASGTHDLRFTLWSALTGGAQAGSAVCLDQVRVTDGLFTVPLDFGAAAMQSQPRFLQIEVRQDETPGNCGTGSFTMLSPRQALTSAPFAANTRGLTVTADGKVGLGDTAPSRRLSVAGGALLLDTANEGMYVQTNSIDFVNASNEDPVYSFQGPPIDRHDFFNGGSSTLTLASNGNIGLAKQNPTARLHMFNRTNSPGYALIEGSRVLATGSTLSSPTRSPASVAVVSGASTWASLDSGRLIDSVFATTNSSTGDFITKSWKTQTVRFSNFGFAIPGNATITGISITVATNNQLSFPCPGETVDAGVRAAPRTPQLSGTQAAAAVPLSGAGNATLGGSTQAFGQSWPVDQVNQSSFAVDVELQARCLVTENLLGGTVSVPCGCGPSGPFRLDGVTVVIHYTTGGTATEQYAWSMGVAAGKASFAMAPTPDLSSPSLVMLPDGRVGVGIEPSGGSGPLLEVAGNIRCISVTETSTQRFKDDVAPLDGSLATLMQLRPVRFRWDAPHGGRSDFGLIAEEVRAVLPELVSTDSDNNASGLNYGRVGVLAVGAIQELQAENELTKQRPQQELTSLRDDLRAQHARELAVLQARYDAALRALSQRLSELERRDERTR